MNKLRQEVTYKFILLYEYSASWYKVKAHKYVCKYTYICIHYPYKRASNDAQFDARKLNNMKSVIDNFVR